MSSDASSSKKSSDNPQWGALCEALTEAICKPDTWVPVQYRDLLTILTTMDICSNHRPRIIYEGLACPLCTMEKAERLRAGLLNKAERKIFDLEQQLQAKDEELGRKDHEITQLEGTIADLREKLTPEPK